MSGIIALSGLQQRNAARPIGASLAKGETVKASVWRACRGGESTAFRSASSRLAPLKRFGGAQGDLMEADG